MVRYLMVVLLAFSLLFGCRTETARQASAPAVENDFQRDYSSFRLPESVTAVAPHFQEHLHKLLIFNTRSWEVKPEFVFAEGDDIDLNRINRGRLNTLVTRMNLTHLAYYDGDELVWSGSVLKGLYQGMAASTRKGHQLKLSSSDEQTHLTFSDGDIVFNTQWHFDRDFEVWLEQGKARLYVHHFIFPEALVNSRMKDKKTVNK